VDKPRWSFRPPAWGLIATLIGCVLMARLGVWQLHRGEQKKEMQRQYAAAATQPPITLSAATPPPAELGAVAAEAKGAYVADHQMLLDGQGQGEASGYDVWTPLRLADGSLVIVNRGWVGEGPDRRALVPLDAPAGEVIVHGLWRTLPEPGMRLGTEACAPPAAWPLVVEYPTAAQLHCYYDADVAAGELLLDPAEPAGYVREWKPSTPGFPPERHYAYAAQWFAFAFTLLVIFFKLNLKRIPGPSDGPSVRPPDRP
jgi:surfeit locus 1 family protein